MEGGIIENPLLVDIIKRHYIKDDSYKIIKIIECKWISDFSKTAKGYATEVNNKHFIYGKFEGYGREEYTVLSIHVQKEWKIQWIPMELMSCVIKTFVKVKKELFDIDRQ